MMATGETSATASGDARKGMAGPICIFFLSCCFILLIFTLFLHNSGKVMVGGARTETGRTPAQGRWPRYTEKRRGEHWPGRQPEWGQDLRALMPMIWDQLCLEMVPLT